MLPEIHVRTLRGDPLVSDYLDDAEAIRPFFAGHPLAIASYRRRADELRARFDGDSLTAMAPAIQTLSDGAASRLAAVTRGEGFLVTTGQQPGLFGGPLYTVHKLVSAIALARRLEAELEQPVLPVFWVASDDHDWAEANHAHLLDPGNTLRRIELAGEADPPLSMGRRRLGPGVETALGEVAQLLPMSDFAPDLLDALRDAYEPGASPAGAFAALLASQFAGFDVGLVDAQDAVVRRLARPVIARELAERAAHEAAVTERTAGLEALGHAAQVTVLEGASNVFLEDAESGRERLMQDASGWYLRSTGRRVEDSELAERLESESGGLSPNVVLRPVVESAVFPTLAYVGGPGEVRYLAQTRGLFEAHGVGMPVVFPRLGVALVEGKVRKVLDRFGLEPGDFSRPVHEVVAGVVREDVPDEVQSALERLRGSIQEGYQALFEAARVVDPTLKGPIFGARNDALRGIGEVEKKVRQHVRQRQETELEQVEKAAVNLWPLGRPQERVLNAHHYLARYGGGLAGGILEAVEAQLREQWPADAVARARGT